jgi:hypothetical protein
MHVFLSIFGIAMLATLFPLPPNTVGAACCAWDWLFCVLSCCVLSCWLNLSFIFAL